jgi:hypothetical protein
MKARLIGVMAWLVLLLLLLLLWPAPAADTGVICRPTPGDRREWWSWREVDGRRCWYLGRPGRSKALLRWDVDVKAMARERTNTSERATISERTKGAERGTGYPVHPVWLIPQPATQWRVW